MGKKKACELFFLSTSGFHHSIENMSKDQIRRYFILLLLLICDMIKLRI